MRFIFTDDHQAVYGRSFRFEPYLVGAHLGTLIWLLALLRMLWRCFEADLSRIGYPALKSLKPNKHPETISRKLGYISKHRNARKHFSDKNNKQNLSAAHSAGTRNLVKLERLLPKKILQWRFSINLMCSKWYRSCFFIFHLYYLIRKSCFAVPSNGESRQTRRNF